MNILVATLRKPELETFCFPPPPLFLYLVRISVQLVEIRCSLYSRDLACILPVCDKYYVEIRAPPSLLQTPKTRDRGVTGPPTASISVRPL